MKTPNEQQWQLLQAHVSTSSHVAPKGVVFTAASLLGERDSLSSIASVDLDNPTTWTFDIVAGNILAHGVVQYDRDGFDAEDDGFGPPPAMTVREAWVRPLTTVIEVGVEAPGSITTGWFAQGAVTLTFTGGLRHSLAHQHGLHSPDKRQRSDEFHAALRSAIGF